MALRIQQPALYRLASATGLRSAAPLRSFRPLRPQLLSTAQTCPPRTDRLRVFSTSPARPQEPKPKPPSEPPASDPPIHTGPSPAAADDPTSPPRPEEPKPEPPSEPPVSEPPVPTDPAPVAAAPETPAAAASGPPSPVAADPTSPPRPPEPNPEPESEPLVPVAAAPDAPASSDLPLSRMVHIVFFFLVGTVLSYPLHLLIKPPVPPAPGTPEDDRTTSVLHSKAAALPIVQQLTADPAFESWAAYQTLTPEHRAQHIMAGTLSGSRGVGGYQRIFFNAATGEFVSVVYLGGGITGWPGVVHGGALATLLDESMARAAFRQWGGRSGVTAKLELEYKAMTLASGFYVVRLRARDDEELEEKERGKRHYKSFVDATIEDVKTGRVTVVARGLFIGGQGNGKEMAEGTPTLAKVEENQKF